jgi:hypothetical protein
LQERQTVKDVEDLFDFGGCNVVDLGREGFKTCVGVQGVNLDMLRRFKERFMISELHIHDSSSFCNGIVDKGKDKVTVVFDLVNLPDYVVPETETVEYFIEACQACACRKR